MFSLSRRIKNQTAQSAPSLDDDVARVAIDEDGSVIYASEKFCALSHIPNPRMRRTKATSLLNFVGTTQSWNTIDSGIHTVTLNGQGETMEFHFDWLTAPNNKRYLIGSEADEKDSAPSDKEKKAFSAKILQLEQDREHAPQSGISSAQDMQRFETLSDDIMVVVDDTGGIVRANGHFKTMTGYTDSDTMAFIDIFHDDDKPYVRNTIQFLNMDSENAAAEIDFEARIIDAEGQEHWLEWYRSQHGNLSYCRGRNVSQIRRQKYALRKREKQLEQAESIGRMGHWHWTLGEDVIEWSDELYRMFGVTRKEFKPGLDTMSRHIHKQDMDRVNQAFQRAIIGHNDYDMEFRITRPDGEIRYIRCEGRCKTDAGEVTGLYGIMQDMTERILYESELKEAKNAAERAYAAKSQFLANMSHELRTPLNAIIGFSEMMQRQLLGPIGTEKYLEYIGGILESGEHLLDLISDILDMSKIEAGKYDLDLEEFNIAKTITMAAHMMENRAIDSEVSLRLAKDTPPDMTIIADRRAVMQILLNLLSNAVKFTNSGGTVEVKCLKRADYVAIKVCDDGIGIPANKLASITRPFEQASSHYTRDHEGSGLGLAITKELIEMHGGSLHIDSAVDIGTTVTVRLPYDASRKKAGREDND